MRSNGVELSKGKSLSYGQAYPSLSQPPPPPREEIETLLLKISNTLQTTALAEGAEDQMDNFCGYW